MRKITVVIIVSFVILGGVMLAAYLQGVSNHLIEKPLNMTLSDYPELFEKDVIIVIGGSASQLEKESAESIAVYLENSTGKKPEIISSKAIESFKYKYNLIIIGTSNSNKILKKVYDMTNATRVTEEYPGAGEGVLEIMRNPWNVDTALLLVAGSDEEGVKAGSMMLTEDEKVKELSGKMKMTEFRFVVLGETQEGIFGATVTTVTPSSDELLGKYETGDKQFERIELGNTIAYGHKRKIDNATVEGDRIVYQFDKDTKELKKKIIHWRDDLPEHLPPVIPKEEAESMVKGKVQFTKLYFISPNSFVHPIKPTPKNPCWVVRSVDWKGNTIVTVIDAVEGKILGYGIPPP